MEIVRLPLKNYSKLANSKQFKLTYSFDKRLLRPIPMTPNTPV